MKGPGKMIKFSILLFLVRHLFLLSLLPHSYLIQFKRIPSLPHVCTFLFSLLFFLSLGTESTSTALTLTPLRMHFQAISLSLTLSPTPSVYPKSTLPFAIWAESCRLWPLWSALGKKEKMTGPPNPSGWESVSVSVMLRWTPSMYDLWPCFHQ